MDYVIKDANINSNCSVKYDEHLSLHTTMKVGGEAKVFIEVDSVSKIVDVIKYARENNINYCVIGNGSNLLFTDEGFDGIVLKWKIDKVTIYPFGCMTTFNNKLNSSIIEEFLISFPSVSSLSLVL